MDNKAAFLNGDVKEEIYIEQPEGFVFHVQEIRVWKLDQFLYGLKQDPKNWCEKLEWKW